MILDFCRSHAAELDPAPTREALARNGGVFALAALPFAVEPGVIQVVRVSSLCAAVLGNGGERVLPAGGVADRIEAIPAPPPAEYARLISKGRILYEHCMTEVSHTCVIGFMHYELMKSRRATRVIIDLLGWMLEQRFQLEDLVAQEGESAVLRRAHTDYMLDHGVSFLHGLDRNAAAALALPKEP